MLITNKYLCVFYVKDFVKCNRLRGYEVLDEMRSIRCIEHTNRAKFITPFVGGQLDICEAFGFKMPEGCTPKYASRKKSAPRRGRPSKPRTTTLES